MIGKYTTGRWRYAVTLASAGLLFYDGSDRALLKNLFGIEGVTGFLTKQT
jgi:hypothetical protein